MGLSAILAATSGTTEVIARPGEGVRLVITGYTFTLDTDVTVIFQNGSENITGTMKPGVDGVVSSNNEIPCKVNTSFQVTLGGAAVLGGHVSYRREKVV